MIRRIATALIVLGMVSPLAASAQWAGPTQAPPSGTTASPINTGSTAQVKSGGLSVGSLINNGGSYFVGNVGIGTSTPGTNLEVFGNVRHSTTGGSFDIRPVSATQFVIGPSTDSANSINFITLWNATRVNDAVLNIYGKGTANWNKYLVLTHDGTSGYIKTAGSTGGDIVLSPQGVEKLRVMTTGNVGIGATTPDSTLQVSGTAQTTANLTDAGVKGGTINITDSNPGNPAGAGGSLLFSSAATNGIFAQAAIKGILYNGSGNGVGALAFSTRGLNADTSLTERMRIDNSGRVGIATTSPLTTLAVGGTITTTGGIRFADGTTQTTAASGGGTVGGSGTTNYLSKFTAASTLGNSLVFDDGTNVGIGTVAPSNSLSVSGTGIFTDGQFIETAATKGLYMGRPSGAGSTESGRVMFVNGTAAQNWQIDNSSGTFRWFTPGVVRMTLDSNSQLTVPGKVVLGPSATLTDAILNASNNNGAYSTAIHGAVVSNSGIGAMLDVSNGVGNTVSDVAVLRRQTNGGIAPAAGLGSSLTFTLDAGSAGAHAAENSGKIISLLTATNGTNNSSALTFHTETLGSLTEKMRIDNAGNVGIGNTAPSSKLSIGSDLGQTGNSLTLGNSSGNVYSYTGQDSTHNLAMGWTYNATPASAFGLIQTYSRANPLYVDGSQLYLNSQSSAGNVGVGTTVPTTKLDVAGTGRVSIDPDDGRIDIASGNDATSYIDFKGSTNLASDYRGRFSYNDGSGFRMNVAGSGTPSFAITEGGDVGIGTVVPNYKLEIAGSTGAVAYYYTSDRSLKNNIQPLSDSLNKILKLQGVSFNWKKDGSKSVGLIAQDVEKVYPELVGTSKTTGLKSVEYGNLVAPLIEAIKEQQKQIDALKAEVEVLKAR